MRTPEWVDQIPGTQVSRVHFLTMLHTFTHNPALVADREIAREVIRKVDSFGVLGQAQIRQALGLGRSRVVEDTLKESSQHGLIPRGRLDISAIGMMFSIVGVFQRKERVPIAMLKTLEGKVSPAMLTLLTGITRKQFRHARKGVSSETKYLLRGTTKSEV